MTATESIDAGIARQIGHYADAVRVPAGYDQILVSGTPGLAPDGSLAADVSGQATKAWRNIQATLNQAGASLSDIVSVRQWLTSAEDTRAYVEVRSKFITHKQAGLHARSDPRAGPARLPHRNRGGGRRPRRRRQPGPVTSHTRAASPRDSSPEGHYPDRNCPGTRRTVGR